MNNIIVVWLEFRNLQVYSPDGKYGYIQEAFTGTVLTDSEEVKRLEKRMERKTFRTYTKEDPRSISKPLKFYIKVGVKLPATPQ